MPQNIGTFISEFRGGTRPNRFKITGNIPGVGGGASFFETHCVASSLPDSSIGIIPIPFRGRIYKFPGDRAYNEWTVTVLDDVGERSTWQNFHDWSNAFNDHETNLGQSRSFGSLYCPDLTVSHLDHRSDIELKTIQFQYAWPVSVGPVTLDMGTVNQISSFQVTIAYTYYKVIPATSSPADANETASSSAGTGT